MDSQEILAIIDLVVPRPLKLVRAEEIFGPVENGTPAQKKLTPKDPRFEYILIETPPASPDTVVSVIAKLARPSPCDLAFFNKVFGEPKVLPRLKPDQPDPHAYRVMYKGGLGQLLLGIKDNLLVTLRVDRFD